MSRDCVEIDDQWRAAIREAARATYNNLMVKKACNKGQASLDELVEARRWKETADAALRVAGTEYRRRLDD